MKAYTSPDRQFVKYTMSAEKRKATSGRTGPAVNRSLEEDFGQETELRDVKSEFAVWERDIYFPSHSLSPDVSPPQGEPQEEPQAQPKKRIRVSKKEIPDYKWTEEANIKLADFMKRHPELFDKRQKDWLNVAVKTQLWAEAGEEQDPPATGAQCKKHYENVRTRVGKILKRELKSGQADRSMRDEEIISTWSFLTHHIVRGNSHPSEEFFFPRSVPVSEEDREEEDVGVPVVQGQGGARISSPSPAASPLPNISPMPSTVATTTTHPDHLETFMQFLSKAEGICQTLSGHRRIVHDFARLMEGHMLTIPENSWHDFQIECLNLVQKFRQQHPPHQQSWQQPQQR